MKKRRRVKYILLVIVSAILVCITWSYFNMRGTAIPIKDKMEKTSTKESNMIKTKNTIAYQLNNDCSGYAIAYVLRSMGKEAEGTKVYKDIPNKKKDGSVVLSEVVNYLREAGKNAELYTGTIDSLEARVDLGIPVIVFVKASETSEIYHYTCVVGYDKEYLYLADSIAAFSNIKTNNYNRRIEKEKFKKLWAIGRMEANNLYITAE